MTKKTKPVRKGMNIGKKPSVSTVTARKGNTAATTSYRSKASFGKKMEFVVIGQMLAEGLDVYVPVVDDHGVDCVIKKADGTFIEVQIKARSNDIAVRNAARFAGIVHNYRKDYYFVFYSEVLDTKWILSSKEFLNNCSTNVNGTNEGKRTITFGGVTTDRKTGTKLPHRYPQYDKFVASDFSRFH